MIHGSNTKAYDCTDISLVAGGRAAQGPLVRNHYFMCQMQKGPVRPFAIIKEIPQCDTEYNIIPVPGTGTV